jgi:hypothetical protein
MHDERGLEIEPRAQLESPQAIDYVGLRKSRAEDNAGMIVRIVRDPPVGMIKRIPELALQPQDIRKLVNESDAQDAARTDLQSKPEMLVSKKKNRLTPEG